MATLKDSQRQESRPRIRAAFLVDKPLRRTLANVNLEELTADCGACGPKSPLKIKSGKPRCLVSYQKAFKHNNRDNQQQKTPYGITWAEAKEIRDKSSCAICGTTDRLVVDHCHTTGVIRGVLCHDHNVALGFFKDNTDHMALAIQYLQNPPGV